MDSTTALVTQNDQKSKLEEFFLSFETKRGKRIFLDILYPVLAFLLALGLAMLVFSLDGYTLFSRSGNTALLIDARAQYLAYLRNFRRLISDGGSLFYTEGKALGGNYITLYSFYLASPYNLLLPLVAEEDIPLFFVWSGISKMAFGSLFFYLFLRYSTHKAKFGYLLFAIAYGFISYNFVYFFNFMWLDDTSLFPLVLLGVSFMKERKHLWLYPLALGYSLILSWYIGALEAIFLIFYLLLNLFTSEKGKKLTFLRDAVIYSILGGMLSAILLIPTYIHMQGTKASFSLPADNFLYVTTFFNAFLENSYTNVKEICYNDGYMAAFCGVVALVFFIQFFFNKGYSLTEKILVGSVCFIYFFSVIHLILYALFHGGKEPTWFPTRYSFVIDALVLTYGGKSYAEQEKVSPFSAIALIIVPIVVLLLAVYVPAQYAINVYPEGSRSYVISIPSLVLYTVTAILAVIPCFLRETTLFTKYQKSAMFFLSLAFVPLSAYSVYRGADQVLTVNRESGKLLDYDTYLEDNQYQADIDLLKAYDPNDNYRMEMTSIPSSTDNHNNNAPMFYSYNGVSHFSSTEIKSVESYLKKLGFYYNDYEESYEGGSTVAANAYLGIKYLVDQSERENNAKAQFIHNTDWRNPVKKLDLTPVNSDVTYYENTGALPLGYVTSKQNWSYIGEGEYVKDKDGNNTSTIRWYDYFEYQNNLYKNLKDTIVDEDGKKKDIFTPLDIGANPSYTASLLYRKDDISTTGYYIKAKAYSSISFYFRLPEDKVGNNLYFSEKNTSSNIRISVDDTYLYDPSYYRKGILSFPDTKSHMHKVTYTFTKDVYWMYIAPSFYYEDLDVLNEYLTALKKEAALNLAPIKGRFTYGYTGDFELDDEDNSDKDFLFTLPYEKQFHIYIDGKEWQTKTSFNVFTAVNLEGIGKGVHSIKIVYKDTSFFVGALISALSLITVIVLALFESRHYKKKERAGRVYLALTSNLPIVRKEK